MIQINYVFKCFLDKRKYQIVAKFNFVFQVKPQHLKNHIKVIDVISEVVSLLPTHSHFKQAMVAKLFL